MRCFHCDQRIERGRSQCPGCGQWQFGAGADRPKKLIPLSEVIDTEVAERVQTGAWDRVIGGSRKPGFRKGCVYLLAGGPGAGKSTLMLQAVDGILAQFPKRPALYLGNEQAADELKEHAVRLELKHFDRVLVPAARGVIEYPLTEEVLECHPCAIVQDSLPGVEGIDLQASLTVFSSLKRAAKDHTCPVIAITHINGKGDIGGLMQLQHAVDATLMLSKKGGLTASTPIRVFSAFKNRTGREERMKLEMTDLGLVAHADDCQCEHCGEEEENYDE